jgi:hypothetical protein
MLILISKVNTRTGHEGPEGEEKCNLTLSLTSPPDREGWPRPRPAAFLPGETPCIHCTGGWVGPRVGVDGCEKSHPNAIRSPDRPARSKSLNRRRYDTNANKNTNNNISS